LPRLLIRSLKEAVQYEFCLAGVFFKNLIGASYHSNIILMWNEYAELLSWKSRVSERVSVLYISSFVLLCVSSQVEENNFNNQHFNRDRNFHCGLDIH